MTVKVKDTNVLIDKEDLNTFNKFKWHISDTGYVVWRGILGSTKKTVRLHRLVIGAKEGEIVDHINRNKLDNRKSNLRIVDHSTNVRNSLRYENYKGYYYDNNKKRWTIDCASIGIKSLYMESEKDCIEYIKTVKQGGKPIRKFTKRPTLGGRKITDRQIDYIFEQFESGKTRTAIAEELGVSVSAIGRIISGKTTMDGTIKRVKKD